MRWLEGEGFEAAGERPEKDFTSSHVAVAV
jgi:hypothetical protein